MSQKKALKISNLVYKASKKYNVPPKVYTAMLMQESAYRLNAVSKACGVLDLDKYEEACVYSDFGMSQINYKTAKKYKMNLTELLTDLEYSINAGAEILSWFHKTYAKREPQMWFTRYNCGTARNVNRSTCNAYKKAVSRWL